MVCVRTLKDPVVVRPVNLNRGVRRGERGVHSELGGSDKDIYIRDFSNSDIGSSQVQPLTRHAECISILRQNWVQP